MEKAVIHFFILGVISGLTKGAGVLQDGPLNAAVGGTVMFTTKLPPQEKPLAAVVWNFKNTNIFTFRGSNITAPGYEGRITVFMSTGSLELRNLAHSDSGLYSANFISVAGAVEVGNTELVVYDPVPVPVVTASSTDLLEFNSSVRLSCSSSGSSPSFLWLNGSSVVTESDRVIVQPTDGGANLTTINVTRFDQGPFRCRVSNPASEEDSEPITLSISYGPHDTSLTKSPSQEYFAEGSDISLMCSADSRPAAQFTWFLNGELQPDAGPELRLMDIQMRQSGNYSCQAFNNKTLRSLMSQPTVVSVLELISGESITTSPERPIEKEAFNLTCEAAGPVFTREWKKEGLDLTLTEDMTLHDGNRVLAFSSLDRKHSGVYSCKISNPFSSQETTYTMNVIYGPEKVQITGPHKILLKETFTLRCSAESSPSATYIWKLNGAEIHKSADFTKINTGFNDSGSYICEAINPITGSTSSAVHELSVTGSGSVGEGGLSDGTIAGIVIACLLVAFAGAAGGYYIYKKRTEDKAVPRSDNKEKEEQVYENTSTIYENL